MAHSEFTVDIDHVFFAAGDALAAECGARHIRELALPLRATAGVVSQSPLGIREAEEATGLPCLNIERMMAGAVVELLCDNGRLPLKRSAVAFGADAPASGLATGDLHDGIRAIPA